MRKLLALALIGALAFGCASDHRRARPATLSYSFYPSDVADVSAESIDTNAVRWSIEPGYKAELRMKLKDAGIHRFEHFNKTHEGQVFELLVNGEILASGLTACPRGPVAEMVWYVESMEQAKHFANILNTK